MHDTAAKTVTEAADFLRKATSRRPDAAVVLGSGVSVLEELSDSVTIPYSEVFGVSPTIAGHAGSLTVGSLAGGETLAVLRGRFHMYEGHDWSIVTLPTRVVIEWGIPSLLLTNAAGGLNSSFSVGDLMVLTGCRDFLHPRFRQSGLIPALHEGAIDCANDLVDRLLTTGKKLSSQHSDFRPLQKGVYAAVLGPNYETLSEIEMLRRLKCDAVGMSTVPELLTAKGTGTTAAAVSVITNVWRDDVLMGGHQEVLEASQQASLRLDRLFRAVLSS